MDKLILAAMAALALAACAAPGGERHAHEEKGPTAAQAGNRTAAMQDNMLGMHEQMHKIMEARDPNERARLMKEHQDQMHEHMRMMGGHGKGGMMGAPAAN